MPVGFPIIDGYDRYDTFDEYARSAANNWTPMVLFPQNDEGWDARRTEVDAYGAKIVAEVDPAAYDNLDDLIDAMMSVERRQSKYA